MFLIMICCDSEQDDIELLKTKDEEIPSQTSLLDSDLMQHVENIEEELTYIVDDETGRLLKLLGK